MKVTVHHLGLIEEAEIELKPLTILVGPNNVGKTWLTYTLSGILGKHGWIKYLDAYIDGKVSEQYLILDTLVQDLFDNGNAVLDLVQFAAEQGEQYINHIAQFAKNWMQEFLSTEKVSFDTLEVQIHLQETKDPFLENIKRATINDRLSVGRVIDKPLIRSLKQSEEQKLYFYTNEGIAEKLPLRAVKEFVIGIVFRELLQALYPDVRTFPTERTTFITFLFQERDGSEEIVTVTNSDEGTAEESHKLRSQSGPVGTFLDMIYALYRGSSFARREKAARQDKVIRQYMQLAQVLEEQILSGKLDYSTPEPEPGREILFKPIGNAASVAPTMEIPIVSSMVKELSPLVLYLRYLAKPGELLVIDEPEMNLHPEAQVKIIEFLAMLVNAGLRVLMTTHSTYVVDQVINLMEAYKQEDQDAITSLFFLQQKEAFISQDNVAVYLVDEGTVESILDENGVIHWNTFSDVTRRVQRIHLAL